MGLRTFTKRYISICEESRGAEGDEALRCESLFSFFVGGGDTSLCLLVVVGGCGGCSRTALCCCTGLEKLVCEGVIGRRYRLLIGRRDPWIAVSHVFVARLQQSAL